MARKIAPADPRTLGNAPICRIDLARLTRDQWECFRLLRDEALRSGVR